MGLRINTNIAALNTSRVLRRSTNALNKSLERLSSGLRINRAADDAAGLAIAEGFKSVVKGSKVAAANAQDGVSLVQTAEGALSETQSILQRIRELAVQSSNGTQSTTNRVSMHNEVVQLLGQIDSIRQRYGLQWHPHPECGPDAYAPGGRLYQSNPFHLGGWGQDE